MSFGGPLARSTISACPPFFLGFAELFGLQRPHQMGNSERAITHPDQQIVQ